MSPSEGLAARLPEAARDEYVAALSGLAKAASNEQGTSAEGRWIVARLVDSLSAELLTDLVVQNI